MRIWHDTSYLTDRDKLMIDRGLAVTATTVCASASSTPRRSVSKTGR